MALQISVCCTRSRAPQQLAGHGSNVHVVPNRLSSTVSVKRNTMPHALPDLGQALQTAPADPEQMTQAVYVGLGLMLVSFVLTFAVAPRFKSSFKEPETWQEIYPDFMSLGGVESVDPEVAAVKASKGVGPRIKYSPCRLVNGRTFGHVNNINAFNWLDMGTPSRFAFFGIYGTERNLNWLEEVAALVPKGTEIIVACDTGGSLEAKTGADTGFQSQSLKAAYFLKKAGYRNVKHLRGGLSEYRRSVGPLVPGGASASAEVSTKLKSGLLR